MSSSLELAKIDTDTGLQEVVGPSLNKVIAVSMQGNFSGGSLYISYAQADACDRITGEPIPEAPRLIFALSPQLIDYRFNYGLVQSMN